MVQNREMNSKQVDASNKRSHHNNLPAKITQQIHYLYSDTLVTHQD